METLKDVVDEFKLVIKLIKDVRGGLGLLKTYLKDDVEAKTICECMEENLKYLSRILGF